MVELSRCKLHELRLCTDNPLSLYKDARHILSSKQLLKAHKYSEYFSEGVKKVGSTLRGA